MLILGEQYTLNPLSIAHISTSNKSADSKVTYLNRPLNLRQKYNNLRFTAFGCPREIMNYCDIAE